MNEPESNYMTWTHIFRPCFAVILIAQLVFLRLFFFPWGVNADRHVLHGVSPGNAVRHSTCGTLDEAPVPSNMISAEPEPAKAAIQWQEQCEGKR
jgi:hypothetical protein